MNDVVYFVTKENLGNVLADAAQTQVENGLEYLGAIGNAAENFGPFRTFKEAVIKCWVEDKKMKESGEYDNGYGLQLQAVTKSALFNTIRQMNEEDEEFSGDLSELEDEIWEAFINGTLFDEDEEPEL